MRYYILLIITLFLFSCGNEKIIQLPEISHSEITELNDVSAAYLFYDETQKDSVELNRKNLISTTNWLVNVDKRLTLKQVIPHIKFLQEKKANSSHKNENAKNYFTCNDISRKDLGFIEFTDIMYYKDMTHLYERDYVDDSNWEILTQVVNSDSILVHFTKNKTDDIASISYSNQKNLQQDLINIISNDTLPAMQNGKTTMFCMFNPLLTFQSYISLKSKISRMDLKNIKVSNDEFISY